MFSVSPWLLPSKRRQWKGPTAMTIACNILCSPRFYPPIALAPPALLKAPGEVEVWGRQECTPGTNMLCRRVKKQRGGGWGCVCACGGAGDILGLRRWWGCPCKLTLWPRSVTHTHAHIHMSFTGLEVETGKQAKKGAKNVYWSHSELYTANQRYPNTAASESQGGEGHRCVVAINTTGCDGFLDLPWFQK